MTQMNSKTATALHLEALEVLKKHFAGRCNVRAAGGSFTALETTIRFEVTPVDPTGQNSVERIMWEQEATLEGFKAEDFGKEFYYGRRHVRIVGWAPPRRRTYPVRCELVNKPGEIILLPVRPTLAALRA